MHPEYQDEDMEASDHQVKTNVITMEDIMGSDDQETKGAD
jgi:hypothetical protein